MTILQQLREWISDEIVTAEKWKMESDPNNERGTYYANIGRINAYEAVLIKMIALEQIERDNALVSHTD